MEPFGNLITGFVIIKVWFDSKFGWYSSMKWFISLGSNVLDRKTQCGIITPWTVKVFCGTAGIRQAPALSETLSVIKPPEAPNLLWLCFIFANRNSPFYVIRRVKGKYDTLEDTTSPGMVRQGGRYDERTIGGKRRTDDRTIGGKKRTIHRPGGNLPQKTVAARN